MNTIYLLPSLLYPETKEDVLPVGLIQKIKDLDIFLVENVKTARRFISGLKIGKVIDELNFHILTKDSTFDETFTLLANIHEDIGILSEAGCPGIADPGAMAVEISHQLGKRVIPMVGPSSILLALMASGFNGQSFAFNGYLPIDKKARVRRIKELEKLAHQSGQTQLFMETPYRNRQLFEALLTSCHPNTKLSISCDLTSPEAFSKTFSIEKWKKLKDISLHKRPAIFGFGS